MNKKFLLKFVAILLFLAGIAGWGCYLFLPIYRSQDKPVATLFDGTFGWKFPVARFPSTGSENQIAYSSIRDPGGVPQGLPVRLTIPVIGVDSAIEDALISSDGRMDVPSDSINVAWFALGPYPGREGSAVIGGHYGIYNDNRGPSVFYNLDKLRVGDKIYIADDKGDTLAFQVRRIELFDRNADATTVFTSDDGLSHLNLITCEGIWNQINGTYPQRRVVFTDAIRADGGVPRAATVFSRSLRVGMTGTDVAALQDILEQKKFLTMPRGISKGFFGALTRNAVLRYQVSVGLPSAGVFGPLTQAQLLAEQRREPGIPNTGREETLGVSSGSEENSPALQTIARLATDISATLTDRIITSTLLLAIIFMIIQIGYIRL